MAILFSLSHFKPDSEPRFDGISHPWLYHLQPSPIALMLNSMVSSSKPSRISNPLLAELLWHTNILLKPNGFGDVKARLPILEVSLLFSLTEVHVYMDKTVFRTSCNGVGATGSGRKA